MRLVTMIPALEEEAAIGSVVRAISREFVHEVIGVDNGSRDGIAAVAQARRGYRHSGASAGLWCGLQPGSARGRTGWPGTAAGGGIYLFQLQRRTLHDKAGPFNDDPFFGFCAAGPCCNFLGADAPAHC